MHKRVPVMNEIHRWDLTICTSGRLVDDATIDICSLRVTATATRKQRSLQIGNDRRIANDHSFDGNLQWLNAQIREFGAAGRKMGSGELSAGEL